MAYEVPPSLHGMIPPNMGGVTSAMDENVPSLHEIPFFAPWQEPLPLESQPTAIMADEPAIFFYGAQTNTITDDVHQQPPPQPRAQRRKASPDHIKHRRVRTGCYTCRSRRVKCDETQPQCERCRKGNRDCVYPSANANRRPGATPAANATKGKEQPDIPSMKARSLSPELKKSPVIANPPLPPTPRGRISQPVAPATAAEESIATPPPSHHSGSVEAMEQKDSPLPVNIPLPDRASDVDSSSRASVSDGHHAGSVGSAASINTEAHLHYLMEFYCQNVAAYHYGVPYDRTDFLRTTHIDIAWTFKPLLYAIASFSAYQEAAAKVNGSVNDFIGYYNKSVNLLRSALVTGQSLDVTALLLTILQLAALEEFLGDWVNLLHHVRAALSLLQKHFTPQTITQSPGLRWILRLFIRFDSFSGFMSGAGPQLDISWSRALHTFQMEEARRYPNETPREIEISNSYGQMLGLEVSALFRSTGSVDPTSGMPRLVNSAEAIRERGATLGTQVKNWENILSPTLKKRMAELKSMIFDNPYEGPEAPPPSNDLFMEPAFLPLCYLWQDYLSLEMIFEYQLARITGRENPAIKAKALTFRHFLEGMLLRAKDRPEVVFGMRGGMEGAALYVQPDEQDHIMWWRGQFAQLERMGYILPHSFCSLLLRGIWHIEGEGDWWLPEQDFSPMIRAIRASINKEAASKETILQDRHAEDVKLLNGIFEALTL